MSCSQKRSRGDDRPGPTKRDTAEPQHADEPLQTKASSDEAAVETRPQSASMNAGEDSRLNDEAFAEAVLRAVELDKSISDLNKDSWHRDKPIWVDMGLTLMSMFRLYDQSDVKLTICPKPDMDVFDCHICMEQFSMGARDPDASKVEQSICSIREHAANRDHIKRMQVARIIVYRSIETGHVLKGAATEFLNSRQEICEQLGKRIQQVNKLLVKWKLQPRDNSSNDEMGDAMPAKFLMLSDSCIAELAGKPSCAACTSFHSHDKCCCGVQAQERSSYIPGKLLRLCPNGVCGYAMESEWDQTWVYSFEAERISCSRRHAQETSSACKGIVSDAVFSLATSLPHVSREPKNMLEYMKELGDDANSRPIFQRLFLEADDKLAWISDLSPHLYYGNGEGIRSSFCSHSSSAGQCFPCQLLERNGAKLYTARAKSKALSVMRTTLALRSNDAKTLATVSSSPLQNLTGQELRQRAAVQSTIQRAERQRAARAKDDNQQLKARVQLAIEALQGK